MKDEINKILDRLERIDHKEYSGGFEFADSSSFDETARCFEERKKMAYYITNLQQKVEQYENPEDLTLFYMWLDEKAKDKMKELQKENKDLKRMCELYGQSLYNADLTKCEARIDKAIEYIQEDIIGNYFKRYDDEIYKMCADLLNILKGDSND